MWGAVCDEHVGHGACFRFSLRSSMGPHWRPDACQRVPLHYIPHILHRTQTVHIGHQDQNAGTGWHANSRFGILYRITLRFFLLFRNIENFPGMLVRQIPLTAPPSSLSASLRNMAFAVILIRAGLSLDFKSIIRLKKTVFLLAVTPGCVVEASVVALSSYLLLG